MRHDRFGDHFRREPYPCWRSKIVASSAIEDRHFECDRKIVTQGPRAERGQATPRAGTFARAGQ
jgi:hypothetical protein